MTRRYLTPAQYGLRFGASRHDYDEAIAALRGDGFVIGELPANHTGIFAHARASVVSAFFHTPLDRRTERGRTFFSYRYAPKIPRKLHALAVVGLENYVRFHPGARLQAHLEGQWWLAASMDHGSDDCRYGGSPAVDYPASSPYVGGTSFAAPEWAAFLALEYRSLFHDIRSGCNGIDGVHPYCARAGYDEVTGLGSFIGSALQRAY